MSTRTPKARALQPADYLKKILTARVYDVALNLRWKWPKT